MLTEKSWWLDYYNAGSDTGSELGIGCLAQLVPFGVVHSWCFPVTIRDPVIDCLSLLRRGPSTLAVKPAGVLSRRFSEAFSNDLKNI